MKKNNIIAWAAAFGGIGVIFGALGAHALEARLDAESLNSFTTAVRYQVWHALALLMLGLSSFNIRFQKALTLCWIAGVILFSGSIYLLSTRELTGWEISFLGPITPVGGLFLIAGWFLLLFTSLQQKHSGAENNNR